MASISIDAQVLKPLSFKILVMCQRKASKDPAIRDRTIKLENIIKKQYPDEYTMMPFEFEYLTSHSSDPYAEMDHELILDLRTNKEETKDFISSRQLKYDCIVLNTCPFRFMDYTSISQLLAPKGEMILMALNNTLSVGMPRMPRMLLELRGTTTIDEQFTHINEDTVIKTNMLIFNKKDTFMGGSPSEYPMVRAIELSRSRSGSKRRSGSKSRSGTKRRSRSRSSSSSPRIRRPHRSCYRCDAQCRFFSRRGPRRDVYSSFVVETGSSSTSRA